MDFASNHDEFPWIMKDGDLIVAYERHDSMDHFYLESGKILNNKFGSFHHNDFIGKPFGTRVKSRISSGWLYALKPTPDLWSLAVHTRTQIVNELDSSFVIQQLDLFPGCKVVESGTGSGCMTLALARAVFPSGKVHSFEFNNVRAERAKEEFQKLGVDSIVSVTCADVCGKFDGSNGGFRGVDDHSVDAVFLDLPEPWLAIDHALRALKPGRNICAYSPCVEQVSRTCDKLREAGCLCIRMFEARQRPFDGRMIDVEVLDLGPSEIAGPFEAVKDVCSTSSCVEITSCCAENEGKVVDIAAKEEAVVENTKKRKGQDSETPTEAYLDSDYVGEQPSKGFSAKFIPKPIQRKLVPVARPMTSMKGHTAFLIFAFAPPATMQE